jgi:hypothetical protein
MMVSLVQKIVSTSPHHHVRRRTIGMVTRLASVAALGALIGATIIGAPAGASGSSIGKFSLTGQVVASLKTSTEFNHSSDLGGTVVSTPEYGCQVGQSGTNSDVINVPDGKLVVNGKSTKATGISFSVPTSGKTVALTATSNDLAFSFAVGKLSYVWESVSGTITTKANGQSGTFSATFDPAKTPSGTLSSGAKTPLQVKGSWTSCHPWP